MKYLTVILLLKLYYVLFKQLSHFILQSLLVFKCYAVIAKKLYNNTENRFFPRTKVLWLHF